MYQEMKSNTYFTEEEKSLIENEASSSFNDNPNVMLIDGCPFVMQGIEALLNVLPVSLNVDNLSVRDRDCDSILLDSNVDVVISGLFGAGGNLLNGFISLDKLKKLNPKVKVIIVTQTKNKSVLEFLVNMGVDALVSCDDSLEEMKRVMMHVLQNKEMRVCSQKIRVQLPHLGEHMITSLSHLTGNEIKVISAILKGHNLTKIGQLATRSVKTMSHYKRSAMRKLRVKSDAKMLQSIQILAGQSIG